MSLINDALKRARQTQETTPPVGPLGAPLEPAEPNRHRPLATLVSVLAVIVALLGAAGWLVWAGWKTLQKPAEAAVEKQPSGMAAALPKTAAVLSVLENSRSESEPMPPAEAPVRIEPVAPEAKTTPPVSAWIPVAPAAKPVESAPMAAAPALVEPPVAPVPVAKESPVAPAVAAENPPEIAAASAPEPVVPEFPALKLQGIYYRVNRPSALVNGKLLFVGDQLDGARVSAITRASVTMEFAGQQRVLAFD